MTTPTTPSGPAEDGQETLIDRAAAGESITAQQEDDLVAYYLGNGRLPGHEYPETIELTLGVPPREKKFYAEIQRVEWEEWIEAQTKALLAGGGQDRFLRASMTIAFALRGKLAESLRREYQRQITEAKAHPKGLVKNPKGEMVKPAADTAELLRAIFADEPGVLIEAEQDVLRLSKIGELAGPSVKVIEAPKG